MYRRGGVKMTTRRSAACPRSPREGPTRGTALRGGQEAHAQAFLAGGEAQGERDVSLADAGGPEQDYVLPTVDVLRAGQLHDQHLVQARNGLEIEALQLLHGGEAGPLYAPLHQPTLTVDQLKLRELGEIADVVDAVQERQVVQWLVDHLATLIGAAMTGDDLLAAGDLDPFDIALDYDLPVGIGHRHRVIHQAVAHQGRRGDPAGTLLTGLEGRKARTPLQSRPKGLTLTAKGPQGPKTKRRNQSQRQTGAVTVSRARDRHRMAETPKRRLRAQSA